MGWMWEVREEAGPACGDDRFSSLSPSLGCKICRGLDYTMSTAMVLEMN